MDLSPQEEYRFSPQNNHNSFGDHNNHHTDDDKAIEDAGSQNNTKYTTKNTEGASHKTSLPYKIQKQTKMNKLKGFLTL